VPNIPDPLAGSYYIESLTAEMEKRANDYIRRIDEMGGMIPAIERGFPQTEIANASYEYQHTIETGEQKIVGVNAFVEQNEPPIELLHIDGSSQQHQLEKLKNLKSRRANAKVAASLDALRRVAEGRENTMPYILEAVRAYATLGEICDAFRDVFGTYTETSVL
jgi:methylmalonyl-CoA mutase N-terminal domain/subunit